MKVQRRKNKNKTPVSYTHLDVYKRQQQNYAIICTCLTGEGAAIKLGNLLRSAIPLIQEYDIEVLCCNKETFKEIDLKGKTILAIVGAVDLLLENVPYIPSDKMILENGLYEINPVSYTHLDVYKRQMCT